MIIGAHKYVNKFDTYCTTYRCHQTIRFQFRSLHKIPCVELLYIEYFIKEVYDHRPYLLIPNLIMWRCRRLMCNIGQAAMTLQP